MVIKASHFRTLTCVKYYNFQNVFIIIVRGCRFCMQMDRDREICKSTTVTNMKFKHYKHV